MIGKVLSCEDVTYIIKFTVPLYIQEAEAIPLDTWNKAQPGDEVYIYQDEDKFGGQYVYKLMGTRDPGVHKLKTDTLEATIDEKGKKFNLNYDGKMSLDIDLSSNKINLSFSGAELTLDTQKIHLGNSGNVPAVLFDKYEQRFKDLYAALANHKHGTAMGPSTPPLPPELPKFSSSFPSTLSQDKSNNVDLMK